MSGPGTSRPRSVLVVEDDGVLAEMMAVRLTAEGYRVVVSGDGADALRAVMREDFDAVVCDMVMPRMAGDMFYYAVHRIKPVLCDRFIFITGFGETPKVKEFLAGLTEAVLMKPFNLEDLLTTLETLLGSVEDHDHNLDASLGRLADLPGPTARPPARTVQN